MGMWTPLDRPTSSWRRLSFELLGWCWQGRLSCAKIMLCLLLYLLVNAYRSKVISFRATEVVERRREERPHLDDPLWLSQKGRGFGTRPLRRDVEGRRDLDSRMSHIKVYRFDPCMSKPTKGGTFEMKMPPLVGFRREMVNNAQVDVGTPTIEVQEALGGPLRGLGPKSSFVL